MILGCAGHRLSDWERGFFAETRPWGFILFARNIDTADQVKALCAELRSVSGHDAPILIDQEGGRVARLRPPLATRWPAVWDQIAACPDEVSVCALLRWRYRLIGAELRELGIDVNCAPLLDLRHAGAHDIIGDRALGHHVADVVRRGVMVAEGLAGAGVLPVIKHIPGHGRAMADSHLELPVVNESVETLWASDFAAFRDFCHARPDLAPLGMTAHVVYSAVDAVRPATTSARVLDQVVRRGMGFDGLLMTDDLSMHALSGDFASRARDSLAAGCDVVLHCNGKPEEMQAMMPGIGPLEGVAARRAEAALAMRRLPMPDKAEAMAALRALGAVTPDALV